MAGPQRPARTAALTRRDGASRRRPFSQLSIAVVRRVVPPGVCLRTKIGQLNLQWAEQVALPPWDSCVCSLL